jgi:hypothetical protein
MDSRWQLATPVSVLYQDLAAGRLQGGEGQGARQQESPEPCGSG